LHWCQPLPEYFVLARNGASLGPEKAAFATNVWTYEQQALCQRREMKRGVKQAKVALEMTKVK